jgi:3-dehydroquinate synthase
MIVESHIALQKKLIVSTQFEEICDTLQGVFRPRSIPSLSFENIFQVVKNDKKTSNSKTLFSLIDQIGNCQFDVPATEKQIEKALAFYNQLIK